jgi:hypothetical protein
VAVAPTSKAAPETAPARPASVAARTPATEALRRPASEPPAAPATKAAPVVVASAPPKAPESIAARTTREAVVPDDNDPVPERPTADADGSVSCPGGMALITTTKFPKGTVNGGKISGEGVAMAKKGQAYCVDRYEFPGAGRRPRTSVTFQAAEGLCGSAKKRLCTDREWQRACGGAYPYGGKFLADRCNTEDDEGEERSITEAGAFKKCRSPSGAFDMSGNVAEWTADQTVRGGDYASADEDAACGAGGKRSPTSARASIGFRCCADFN